MLGLSVNVYSMKKTMDTAIKLAQAMSHLYGTHLVINTRKFYGHGDIPVTMYSVRDSYRDDSGWHDEELFKTTSMFQVTFFLRDLFFAFKGEEAEPIDDERWQNARAKADVDKVISDYKELYLGSNKL